MNAEGRGLVVVPAELLRRGFGIAQDGSATGSPVFRGRWCAKRRIAMMSPAQDCSQPGPSCVTARRLLMMCLLRRRLLDARELRTAGAGRRCHRGVVSRPLNTARMPTRQHRPSSASAAPPASSADRPGSGDRRVRRGHAPPVLELIQVITHQLPLGRRAAAGSPASEFLISAEARPRRPSATSVAPSGPAFPMGAAFQVFRLFF